MKTEESDKKRPEQREVVGWSRYETAVIQPMRPERGNHGGGSIISKGIRQPRAYVRAGDSFYFDK